MKTFDIRDPAEAEQTQEEADWAWYAHFFPEVVADLWEPTDEEACAELVKIFFWRGEQMTTKVEPQSFPAPWGLSKDNDAIVDANGVRILTISMGYGEADLDYWPKALATMLAAPDMLAALGGELHLSTARLLDWAADRMVYVYGENENVDFVQSMRNRAALCREALQKAKVTP